MFSLLWSLALAATLFANQLEAQEPGSYLLTLCRSASGELQYKIDSYAPQPGDLVLYDDLKLKWKILYNMFGTEPPDHSGIVIALPDGRPALLESGPDDETTIQILDAMSRLRNYPGTVWIRRLKTPLTPEKSLQLTEFAKAKEGKRYATGRLLLQGTPFRCRGPLRIKYFGKTDLDRESYLCSELVVAAGTVAGLFDPAVHKANAIYPRDMIADDKYDLSQTWHPAGLWTSSAQSFQVK